MTMSSNGMIMNIEYKSYRILHEEAPLAEGTTHTYARARTHTHTHTYAHARMHTHTQVHTQTCVHVHVCVCKKTIFCPEWMLYFSITVVPTIPSFSMLHADNGRAWYLIAHDSRVYSQ